MKDIINYTKQPKIAISLSIILVLFLANIIQIIFSVHHQDFRIATRYSVGTQSVIATGYWYNLYNYAIFIVLAVAFNLFAGWKLVTSNRRTNLAFALLLFTIFILFFSFLVGHVIFGLASGV